MGCFGGKGAAFYPGLGFPGAKIESGTNISHMSIWTDIHCIFNIQGQHLIQACLIIRIFTMIWYELRKGWKLVENRYFLNLNLVL